MADGPRSSLLLMTGISAGRRVSETKRLRHLVAPPLNGSGKSAIANTHEFTVPVLSRHPEFHVDERVGSGLEDHLNSTMLRNVGRWCRWCAASRRSRCI